jgi:hypothetical protein
MAQIKTSFGTVEYTDFVGRNDYPVEASLWEKGDHCRIYFSVRWEKGVEKCGFYDVKNRLKCTRSSPAAWGHEIKNSIEHTS